MVRGHRPKQLYQTSHQKHNYEEDWCVMKVSSILGDNDI